MLQIGRLQLQERIKNQVLFTVTMQHNTMSFEKRESDIAVKLCIELDCTLVCRYSSSNMSKKISSSCGGNETRGKSEEIEILPIILY